MDQQSMTADQYKAQHLKNRIGEIVADYEDKMATGAMQVLMFNQQLSLANARIAELEAQLAQLAETEQGETADDAEGASDNATTE